MAWTPRWIFTAVLISSCGGELDRSTTDSEALGETEAVYALDVSVYTRMISWSELDCLWSAEHHFTDYSFVPDNLQLMAHLTALCPDIDLGTAAVILPWHDPLRVAENASVVDMLSKGRLRLGLGRGLARREFAAFRLSMDESRERFDEAAPMIVKALKTGFIEGDGPFYKIGRAHV